MRRLILASAAAAVLLAPALPAQAGGFCADPAGFQDRATTTVVMKGDCFGPTVARIQPGDEVTFRNLDLYPHTVGGVASSFGDAHKEILEGEQVSFGFDEEGVYPFFCVIHPGMVGAVVVTDGVAGGSRGVAAAPAEPASAPDEKATTTSSLGQPLALVAAIAAFLTLGLVAVRVAVRRRRAIDLA